MWTPTRLGEEERTIWLRSERTNGKITFWRNGEKAFSAFRLSPCSNFSMPPKPLPLWKNGYFTLPSLFDKKDYFFIIYLFIFENFQLWIYGVLGCFDWWVFVNLDFCLWVFCFWFDELCDIRYLIDGFIYFLIFLWDLGCGLFGWLGNVWLGFRILLFGREKSYNSLVQYRFIVLFDGFFSPLLYMLGCWDI